MHGNPRCCSTVHGETMDATNSTSVKVGTLLVKKTDHWFCRKCVASYSLHYQGLQDFILRRQHQGFKKQWNQLVHIFLYS